MCKDHDIFDTPVPLPKYSLQASQGLLDRHRQARYLCTSDTPKLSFIERGNSCWHSRVYERSSSSRKYMMAERCRAITGSRLTGVYTRKFCHLRKISPIVIISCRIALVGLYSSGNVTYRLFTDRMLRLLQMSQSPPEGSRTGHWPPSL